MKSKESISEFVWKTKYQYKTAGKIHDKSLADTWNRVATHVAQAEPEAQREHWQHQFLDILKDFQFLPGGRILAGAGTNYDVTLFNCFVMGKIEDSLTGIFSALQEGAETLQQGGGVGFDFSSLRPSGVVAARTGNIASGPVSFMRIWDSMSATMQSTGARRGAMMGTLRCDHPDIEAFIAAKKDSKELRQFNVSVLITDEFMQAVKDDKPWALVFPLADLAKGQFKKNEIINRRWSGSAKKVRCGIFKTVKARKLWTDIIKAAYDYAEPGVIFEDTLNRNNNLRYCEWISATNPCGEIPLPNYGACDLGSINLTQFVKQPFTDKAEVDWQRLAGVSRIATRFLDNVITVSKYPLDEQQQQAEMTRRIGLGITGLADALVMLGMRYGDAESIGMAGRLMRTISHSAWLASVELAWEKKSFPAFDKKRFMQGPYVKSLPAEIRQAIRKYGLRNSHHTAIAPTGTISLLANNVSSGIEPIFSAEFKRQVRDVAGELHEFKVQDYAYQLWRKKKRGKELPLNWIDAEGLQPIDHLNIQAAIQPHVDNAISKTIFVPEKFEFAKLKQVYQKAYEMGLKGCTIFRPNPITGSVIATDECCLKK